MKLIKNVKKDENGLVELQVVCPFCNRHIFITEDTPHCSLCFAEFEEFNINVWEEYKRNQL